MGCCSPDEPVEGRTGVCGSSLQAGPADLQTSAGTKGSFNRQLAIGFSNRHWEPKSWTWVQGQTPLPRRTKAREKKDEPHFGRTGCWEGGQVNALSLMGSFNLWSSRQKNIMKLLSLKLKKEVGAKLAKLASLLPSTELHDLSPVYCVLR